MKVKDITLIGLLAAVLLILQVALGPLPNIEVVSLLVIVYAMVFGKRIFYILAVFAVLEGLIYGFGIWWIMYLYVWPLLAAVSILFKKTESVWVWAVISGGFGLAFGALCAIPYAVGGGMAAGIAWWISGIPFDIIHGISNFILALFLLKPLRKLLEMLKVQIYRGQNWKED